MKKIELVLLYDENWMKSDVNEYYEYALMGA